MKNKEKIKIQKVIRSFEKLKKIHQEKIKDEKRNYAVVGYWEKQVERFDEEIKKKKRKLAK
mgnify:CR=1 FL=1